MLKKTILAAMVVAAVAAVAAPTMATAQNWTHHDQDLQGNENITLTGNAKFTSGIVGSIECETTAELTAIAKSTTGTVNSFDPDTDEPGSSVTSKCHPTGFIGACDVHIAQPTDLPWDIHNETDHVKIISGDIHITMTGGFCPAKRATVTAVSGQHAVTATPDDPHTVSDFTLSGEVNVHLYGQHSGGDPFRTSTAVVSGTQTIIGGEDETYSLT